MVTFKWNNQNRQNYRKLISSCLGLVEEVAGMGNDCQWVYSFFRESWKNFNGDYGDGYTYSVNTLKMVN